MMGRGNVMDFSNIEKNETSSRIDTDRTVRNSLQKNSLIKVNKDKTKN